jgi:hypothetical protein
MSSIAIPCAGTLARLGICFLTWLTRTDRTEATFRTTFRAFVATIVDETAHRIVVGVLARDCEAKDNVGYGTLSTHSNSCACIQTTYLQRVVQHRRRSQTRNARRCFTI